MREIWEDVCDLLGYLFDEWFGVFLIGLGCLCYLGIMLLFILMVNP